MKLFTLIVLIVALCAVVANAQDESVKAVANAQDERETRGLGPSSYSGSGSAKKSKKESKKKGSFKTPSPSSTLCPTPSVQFTPKNETELQSAVDQVIAGTWPVAAAPISEWDTSLITDMSTLF